MSACPVPDSSTKLSYGTPATLTATNPDPSDESCNVVNENTTEQPSGASTTVTQTQFCAGPPGPEGPPGTIPTCEDIGITGFSHEGEWTAGTDYYNQGTNDEFGGQYECNATIVENNGSTYVCVYGHTADSDVDGDEPGVGLNWEFYWMPWAVAPELTEEESSIFDIGRSLWDHILDIPNWGIGDWIKGIGALALGAYAVNEVIDMMNPDAGEPSTPDTGFSGDPSYSGAPIDAHLHNIVEHVCLNLPFNVDTTLLTNHELSFKRWNPIQRGTILAQLSLVYAFSIVPSGGTLRFVDYNSPVVKTLDWDDFGFDISSSNTSRYKVERTQGIDLPRKINVQFPDRNLNYQDNVAPYEIQGFPQGQETTIQVPFVMTYEEARGIAERALKLAHLEATQYTYTISWAEHMELEPGDNINTPLGQHRILKIRNNKNGGMELKTVDASFVSEFSVPSGSGLATSPTPTDTVQTVGISDAIIVDMPPLNSDDTEGRLFAAVHGFGREGWRGAGIYQSFDGGGSYDFVNISRQESTFGRVESAIPAPYDYHVWDDDTVITVELRTGELLSVDDDTLYASTKKNHAMIGSEMIAFGEATLVGTSANGNPLYELTHLMRGLRGTEWAVGEHEDNELFVLIDDTLVELPYPIDERGKPRHYKIISVGGDATNGVTRTITPYGINLIPWAPSHGRGEKLGATDDWLIQWEGRQRFFTDEFPDFVEASGKDFDWAGWTIIFLDQFDNEIGDPVHVKVPNYTLTEAEQISRYGSVQNCIKVRVFQNSSIVGGGYGWTFTCT